MKRTEKYNQKAVAKEYTLPYSNINSDFEDTEIDLLELLHRIVHYWFVIVICVLIGAIIAGVYTNYYITPMYSSTAKLYVLNSQDSFIDVSDLTLGNYLATDYIEMFNTWELHQKVIDDLQLPYTDKEMQNMLTVTNPTETRILYITIHSPDPQEAAVIANGYANAAKDYITDIMMIEEPNIMSKAQVSSEAFSPSIRRNIVLGAFIGLLLSVGWIAIRFLLDDRIKSIDDIRRYTNLPVLAVVPKMLETGTNNIQGNAKISLEARDTV